MPFEKGKDATLTAIVPVDIADKFREIAKKNKRSVSAELSILVERHINDHDKSAKK